MGKYEDEYDAINQAIAATGRSRKEIAALLYPGRKLSTAESLLSRLLSPESTDVNLSVAQEKAIMRATRSEDVIYQLCDEFGFERPIRKKAALETEIKLKMESMQQQMSSLADMLQKVIEGKSNKEGEG